MDDTLDDILAGSDEEEESEQLVSQVLDEIGLDTTSKVNWYSNAINTVSLYHLVYITLYCVDWAGFSTLCGKAFYCSGL